MNPHIKLLVVGVVTTFLVTISLESVGQEPASNKKAYVRTGQEVTLSGTVSFSGKAPKPSMIDMSADPECYRHNRRPQTEWLVVRNEGLANVLVYATSETILDSYSFEPPSSAVALEHKHCRYQPRVLGMQTSQVLNVINGDATHHNTHPAPKLNREWNQTQPPNAPPIVKTFERAELFVSFNDNQHPWEKAYVSIFNHPFFAVTDAYGNYRIEGLPPGPYKIIAWHERLGEKIVDVVFVPGEARYLGFAFAAADLRK